MITLRSPGPGTIQQLTPGIESSADQHHLPPEAVLTPQAVPGAGEASPTPGHQPQEPASAAVKVADGRITASAFALSKL